MINCARLARRTVLLGGIFLSAIGSVAAQDLEKVSVRLDYLPGANHSALYMAKERGYYADAGLDVELLAGQGSTNTIQVVAAGTQDIGLASLSAVATAVGRGVPVIGIAGIMQRAPESVISLQETGPINSPRDLEGKTMGAEPGDQAQRLFEAFAAANGVDLDKIRKVNVSKTGALQALLNGDVDFVSAWAFPDGTKANRIKPINPPMMFADYGVNTLSTGIFVTKKTAGEKGDMLRRFIAATVKGADDVARDPMAGVEAVKKAVPESDIEVLELEIENLPNMLHTANSKDKPFGWVAPEDVALTLKILQQYFDLPESVTAEQVYTAEFQSAE